MLIFGYFDRIKQQNKGNVLILKVRKVTLFKVLELPKDSCWVYDQHHFFVFGNLLYVLFNRLILANVIDKQKQIDYWISSANSDLETAELLIKNNKLLHGLFFCHLVIEKALKANIVKVTSEIPPKSHNLILLLEKTELELGNDYEEFLGILMKYQLEGRYPDYNPVIPDQEKVSEYKKTTINLFQWLKEKL